MDDMTASPILNPDGSWGMTAEQFRQLLKELRPVIRNLTPHPINLYLRDDTDLGSVHFGPDSVVPVAGPPARLRTIDLGEWHEGTAVFESVEFESVEFGHVNGLPDPEPGVWYVVSLPVALACRDRRDLLVPYREVRDENGTVVGCRSLARPS